MAKKKKSKAHKALERYLDMPVPKRFLNEVLDAMNIYANCDRTALELECTRMFAYMKVSEAYVDELECRIISNTPSCQERIKKEELSPIGYNPVKEFDAICTDSKIREGDVFECIKDVIEDGCIVHYRKGDFYRSRIDGCITDTRDNDEHEWDNSWQKYFKRVQL